MAVRSLPSVDQTDRQLLAIQREACRRIEGLLQLSHDLAIDKFKKTKLEFLNKINKIIAVQKR